MRRLVILASGWVLIVIGLVLSSTPVPIPLIGAVPLLVGSAMLSSTSKSYRRWLQSLRHRFEFVSRWLDGVAHRMPLLVAEMIRRTNPLALDRHARMRVRRSA